MTAQLPRVLIVDDSVVVRRILSDLVNKDPDLELVGIAQNGNIAIQKLKQLPVDIVIMDVEMPDMDGIDAVTQLRVNWPRLPVLMCSSITMQGADATMRALAAGATDYIAKPSRMGRNEGLSEFESEFIAKIKALTLPRISTPITSVPYLPETKGRALVQELTSTRRVSARKPAILAIGCSTGGPNALATLFKDIPEDLGVPIVITQHMPPLFTKLLAERLDSLSSIHVKEATAGDVLEPNCAYIAPGDYHMVIQSDGLSAKIALNQEPKEHSCRPAVDVMFRSVAKVFGPNVVAAVLTGMGNDGSIGADLIAKAGGWVITQTADSCVVASMPNSVVEIGASHESLDLASMGSLFGLRCKSTRVSERSKVGS